MRDLRTQAESLGTAQVSSLVSARLPLAINLLTLAGKQQGQSPGPRSHPRPLQLSNAGWSTWPGSLYTRAAVTQVSSCTKGRINPTWELGGGSKWRGWGRRTPPPFPLSPALFVAAPVDCQLQRKITSSWENYLLQRQVSTELCQEATQTRFPTTLLLGCSPIQPLK